MAGELGKVHLPLKQLEETLSKLTVPELQQRLKKRGLRKSGVKAKLIQRLAEAIESEKVEEEEQEEANVDLSKNEENDQVVENLDESTGATDSNAVESEGVHDPYTEFESNIPGVAEVQQNKKINETSTEDADIVEGSRQNEDLNDTAGSVLQKDETYGRTTAPDAMPSDPDCGEQELVPHSSGQAIDTSEVKYDGEDEVDIQQSHLDAQLEGPEIQNTSHHESEAEFAPMEEPENETQVENSTSHEEGGEGMPAEIAKDDVATEEQIDTGANVVKSDDFEAHQGDSEEVGIEIGLGKDEKEDFTAHEGDEGQQQDVSMKKETRQRKKKVTAPVQLKKRRNVTEAEQEESKQDAPVPRKRRWGSSRSNESLTISSESLKGLIPDVSMIPTPNEDPLGLGLDYCEVEEGEIDEVVEAQPQLEEDSEVNAATEAVVSEEGSFKKEVRKGRIVRISTKDTVKLSRAESKEEEEEKEEETKNEIEKDAEMEITIPEEKVSLLPEVASEDPEYVGDRSPSPAKNPPGKILSIRNLVRPFTLRQLREFLSKAGTVMEEGFWIDRIKSHCYVTYETVDDAVASRSLIHGMRWPAANPKLLSADFAINEEMFKETEGKLGTAPAQVRNEAEKPQNEKTEEVPKKKERSAEKERRRHSRSQDKDKKGEVSAKPKEKKEAPAKLLDDLFRKTKALPCIYWLPLTKEQVTAKDKEREQRREERRKLNEKEEGDVHQKEDSIKQREIEAERRERDRNRQDARAGRQVPDHYRSRRRMHSP